MRWLEALAKIMSSSLKIGQEPQKTVADSCFLKEAQYEKTFKEPKLKVSIVIVPPSQRRICFVANFCWK